MTATETLTEPKVSIIVPARNEEASLAACLESLVAQQGVPFEILVVDDHSTDRTREIASSFASARPANARPSSVRVLDAAPLPAGWTGKNNAVATGAREAKGEWLLFTDADTVHVPGSLARALKEAEENGADLLSYSPEQIAVTFWEMATLPVVFAELARQYPPSKVSDPNSPAAAANGQFILISRGAYDAVGGHAAVAHDILEDVALARAVKRSGRKIRFRYAADAVRTRMYRNFRQLREGWTKNLALLFPNPGWLAAKTLLWWGLGFGILLGPLFMILGATLTDRVVSLGGIHDIFLALAGVVRRWWWPLILIPTFGRNLTRLRRANFDLAMEFLGALFGMPMFAYLLLRSRRAHANDRVTWKGRIYGSQDGSQDRRMQDNLNKLHQPTTAGRLS
jgi:glycosyltransferase involved in cell wall biosynthesis